VDFTTELFSVLTGRRTALSPLVLLMTASGCLHRYGSTGDPDFPKDPTTKDTAFLLETTVEKAHDSDVNCVAWCPTKPNLLASCGDDKLVKIWEYVQ
jgi:WD40 repeat protein